MADGSAVWVLATEHREDIQMPAYKEDTMEIDNQITILPSDASTVEVGAAT